MAYKKVTFLIILCVQSAFAVNIPKKRERDHVEASVDRISYTINDLISTFEKSATTVIEPMQLQVVGTLTENIQKWNELRIQYYDRHWRDVEKQATKSKIDMKECLTLAETTDEESMIIANVITECFDFVEIFNATYEGISGTLIALHRNASNLKKIWDACEYENTNYYRCLSEIRSELQDIETVQIPNLRFDIDTFLKTTVTESVKKAFSNDCVERTFEPRLIEFYERDAGPVIRNVKKCILSKIIEKRHYSFL